MKKKSKYLRYDLPARIGSSRLKYKNFALLDDKPLISYAINAAKQSGVFDDIVLNSG